MARAALKETGALILAWKDAAPWYDGYSIFGPFPNKETATDAAGGDAGPEWAVASIYAPKGADIGNTAHAGGDRFIVVIGDLVDGFMAFGPFTNVKGAKAWAAKHDGKLVIEMLRVESYEEELANA
jgi:hypothetical protein